MSKPFRFGVSMRGAGSKAEWVTKARRAEALGFSSLVMPDHLIGTRMSVGPALVLAAEVTTRLRVGSFVFDNDFRHPAVLAQEAATVDVLTAGRFEFGIGAGWMREEYDKTGIPFVDGGARVDRMAEALTIIKGLFGDQAVTLKGKHYTVSGLEGTCKPIQQPHPPILIGGGGTRLLTIAAAQADIISIMPRSKRDGSALEDGDATAGAFDRKLEVIRDAAGSRFEELEFNTLVQEVIVRIRDARNQVNVESARRIPVILVAGSQAPMLESQAPLIEFLARTEKPQVYAQLEQKPEQSISQLAGPVEIYLPLAGMIDTGKELERLDKEIAQARQEIARLQGKLANESFVTRAKPEVVEKEREKLAAQEERIEKLEARRVELAG